MFKIVVGENRLIGVAFSHHGKREPHPDNPSYLSKFARGFKTIDVRHSQCRLVELFLDSEGNVLSEELLGEGETRCDPRDNFRRSKGRRVALDCAMQFVKRDKKLDALERETFWNEIFKLDPDLKKETGVNGSEPLPPPA